MANTNVAATISKSSGPLSVERGGQTITLNQGDSVYATDVINTQGSSVELAFVDGAKAILSPNSTMTVQEFSYNVGGESSFVINLAEGAMRSISGKVVEQNPDAFKVVTPKATVGIRGTDFGTQVNADGTEAHLLFAIDQGHNLLITTHSGNQISLNTANQGAFISADELSHITPHDFTEEEIVDFLGYLFDMTDKEEILNENRKIIEEEFNNVDENTDQVLLMLDQALIASLSEGNSTSLPELAEGDVFGIPLQNDDGESLGAEGDIYLEDLETVPSFSIPEVGELDLGFEDDDSDDDGGDDIEQVSGGTNHYADAEFYNSPGVTHNLIDHTFNIDGDIGNGLVISGDAGEITEGTVNAGNDTITGGNITDGRIVGDANTVGANASVNFGNDNITVDSKTGGSSIYGDAHTIAIGATVSFGDDTITVKGELANTVIAGDVFDDQGATVNKWGNDTISVGNMNATTADAIIYGDSSNSTSNGGNDTITVHGTMAGDATAGFDSTINAGGGDDTIHVGTLGDNATINADDGNDTISVNNFAGGFIDGGAGIDRFVWTSTVGSGATQTIDDLTTNGNITNVEQFAFQSLANGTIEGTIRGDEIFVYNTSGGTVNTAAGNDTTTFTNAVGGSVTINNSADTDNLYLNNGIANGASVSLNGTGDFSVKQNSTTDLNFNSGILNLNDATNSITLASMSGSAVLDTADGATVDITGNMSGGIINGGTNADDVTISGTMSSGTLNLNAGTNTVSVGTLQGGTINGGNDSTTITVTQAYSGNATITSESATQHSVNLNGGMSGGSLTLSALNSSTGGFNVNGAGGGFAMNNGIIYGSAASDTFTIGTMQAGEIKGDTASSSSDDTFNVTIMNGGTIYGDHPNSGASVGGSDTINITGNIASGTIHGGAGIDTITINNMDNGNINGGDGADIIKVGYNSAGGVVVGSGMIDGSINGGAGADNINVTAINAGSINGGDDNDIITVDSMEGGTINGGAGSDTIAITSMFGGNINGGAGADNITITNGINSPITITNNDTDTDNLTLSGGIIAPAVGGSSNVTLSGPGAFNFANSFDIASGAILNTNDATTTINLGTLAGNLNTGSGNDTVSVTTFSGTINTGAGDDDISVDALNGTINAGAGTNIIRVTNDVSANITDLSANTAGGTDQYEFTSLSSGNLNGTANVDHIYIKSMTGGDVNGGAGADNISIGFNASGTQEGAGMSNASTIDGGAGNDNIKVVVAGGGVAAPTINVGNGNDIIDIYAGAVNGSITIDSFSVGKDVFKFEGTTYSASTDVVTSTGTATTFGAAAAAGETITITQNGIDVNVSFINHAITIDGNTQTWLEDEEINSTQTYTNNNITINGDVNNDISADIKVAKLGNYQVDFGSDTINGGSINGGKIYGDAETVESDVIANFGNDNITFQNNAGEIYGDAKSVSTLNATFGSDNITITGTMSGGKIYGDFEDSDEGANDIITIGILTDGEVHGGGGADTISITNMSKGEIEAGAGADTLNVTISNTGDKGDALINLTDTDNARDTINFGQVTQNGTKVTIEGFKVGEDVINYNGALQNIADASSGATHVVTDGANTFTIYFA